MLHQPKLTPEHLRQHAAHLAYRRRIDAGATRLVVVETQLERAKHELSELMQPVFESFIDIAPQTRMELETIQHVVAQYFGIKPEQLVSKERTHRVSHPRFLCMYLAKRFAGYSYAELGRRFKTDHSTSIYGARFVALRIGDAFIPQPKESKPLPLNEKLREDVRLLRKFLGM